MYVDHFEWKLHNVMKWKLCHLIWTFALTFLCCTAYEFLPLTSDKCRQHLMCTQWIWHTSHKYRNSTQSLINLIVLCFSWMHVKEIFFRLQNPLLPKTYGVKHISLILHRTVPHCASMSLEPDVGCIFWVSSDWRHETNTGVLVWGKEPILYAVLPVWAYSQFKGSQKKLFDIDIWLFDNWHN